jgi:type I restriction-modification system DNA methylase subunit
LRQGKKTSPRRLEKRLWDAADQFRANSGLKSQEYSAPVLGLIFLRFAEVRFAAQRTKLEKAEASSRRGSRVNNPAAYHAEGILYLPAEARFDQVGATMLVGISFKGTLALQNTMETQVSSDIERLKDCLTKIR